MVSYDTGERFDAIYQLFSRRYPLKQNKLMLGKRELTLYSIDDMDQLLDELIALGPEDEAVIDERLPYWAELWPASIALSQFIYRNSELISGKSVIELGCGIGLSGITAALQGAVVTITDYQPDALKLAELNWLMNIEQSPVSILMDWRSPNINQKFDIIVASDVVYEKRFFRSLIKVFKQNLASQGQVILSEPNRKIAESFFEILGGEGYSYQNFPMDVSIEDKVHRSTVYLIERKN